jgi:hypothetical protein
MEPNLVDWCFGSPGRKFHVSGAQLLGCVYRHLLQVAMGGHVRWGKTRTYDIHIALKTVLRNCNYFFTVPVPTFDKLRFRLRILDRKKQSFQTKIEENLAFLHGMLFYKERIDKFYPIY